MKVFLTGIKRKHYRRRQASGVRPQASGLRLQVGAGCAAALGLRGRRSSFLLEKRK